MPLCNYFQLFTALALCAVSGCDLRVARFDFQVKGGTLRVRQFADEIVFTFVDKSGIVRAEEKQAIPYGTTEKDAYVMVDLDEDALLLKHQSIINRLPKDKTDEGALLQEVLEQVTTVAHSRAKREFVDLQTNRVRSIIPPDAKLKMFTTVNRIDIHETVDAQLVATLHNFPSLVTVLIGNQRIETNAFEAQHLPETVRTLNIAHCGRILNPEALVSELKSSGVTDLRINKNQMTAIGDKLRGKMNMVVGVISPD